MLCGWCDEELTEAEMCSHVPGCHHECAVRMVIGSAGHQLGMCACVGGSREDPPEMTRRQAAKLAMAISVIRRRDKMSGPVAAVFIYQYFPGAASMAELLAWPPVNQLTGNPSADMPSIRCPKCGRLSINPRDVQERYCGACHEFHDQMILDPNKD